MMKLYYPIQALNVMKHAGTAPFLIAFASLGLSLNLLAASNASAQDRIFRCPGNEYTNNAQDAATRGCKPLEGGHITIVSASKPAPAASGVKVAAASPAGSRIDSPEQRGRDSDARAILEAELKKIEAKQSELLKEFNNGEPEKRGPETRNHQLYLDRVAEMKAQIARNDADLASIRREIQRLGGSAPSAASGSGSNSSGKTTQ